jgi:hypothetical protein
MSSELENTLPRQKAVELFDGSVLVVPKLTTLDYLTVLDAVESLPGPVIEAAAPHFLLANSNTDLPGGLGYAAALINALPGMLRAGLPETLNLIAAACKADPDRIAALYPEDHLALVAAWFEINRVDVVAERLKNVWSRLAGAGMLAGLAEKLQAFTSPSPVDSARS